MNEHLDGPEVVDADADVEALLRRWRAASARSTPIPSDTLLAADRRAPRRRTARNLAMTAVVAAAVLLAMTGVGNWAAFRAASNPATATAHTSPSTSPAASGPASTPQPGYLPGSGHLSGSSAWMTEPYGSLSWSADAGRTWTQVAYPVGVTSDQVTAMATAPDRPMWLAVRSGDGYSLYRKADVAAAWSSVPLTPSAAVPPNNPALFVYLTPGPGRMLTAAELMADGSAILFVSDDDGLSFVQHRSPAGSQMDMNWAWATFTTADSGVAIERTGPQNLANPFLHTSDGGKSWVASSVVVLPAAGSYRLGSPRLVGTDIEVPIGTCGSTCGTSQFFSLLVSHDGGATFNPMGVPTTYEVTTSISFGNGTWAAPAFDTRGSSTWVATGGRIIEETADGGQTWTAVQAVGLPNGFATFAELVLTGPTSATAVVGATGQAGDMPWAKQYLLATTDGGRTWTLV